MWKGKYELNNLDRRFKFIYVFIELCELLY
jgi:hypothetical protein